MKKFPCWTNQIFANLPKVWESWKNLSKKVLQKAQHAKLTPQFSTEQITKKINQKTLGWESTYCLSSNTFHFQV